MSPTKNRNSHMNSPSSSRRNPFTDCTDLHTSSTDDEHWLLSNPIKVFFQNLRNGTALGRLVGQAHFQLPNVGDKLEIESIQLYMHYAFLLRKLSPKVQALLTELLNDFEVFLSSQSRKDHEDTVVPFLSIMQLPSSQKVIRRTFFKGNHAFFPNLPLPKIHIFHGTSHAYVLPSEVIAWFFGFSQNMSDIIITKVSRNDSTYPLDHIGKTCRIQNKLQSYDDYPPSHRDASQVFLSEWADDFEPNYGSHNRGSVFIKTITFVTRKGTRDNSAFTFPIILGKKGDNHNLVEVLILEDMNQLLINSDIKEINKYPHFGVPFQQMKIPVALELVASICDQPARREYTCLGAGNGKYTARWGYVGNWLECSRHIPCCTKCFRVIFDLVSQTHSQQYITKRCNATIPMSCLHCTNWMYNIDHDLLQYDTPRGYPTSNFFMPSAVHSHSSTNAPYSTEEWQLLANATRGQGQKKLRPFKINFDFLTQAVQHTHLSVINKEWTVSEAKIYLWTTGLSTKAICEIIDCADNCLLLQESYSQDSDDGLLEELSKEAETNPHLFKMWQSPPSWNRKYGMDIFNNAPMHLLSGVAKTTNILALEWMKPNYDMEGFVKQSQQNMQNVASLGLGWCRLPPKFGGKFVGSLSENWISLTRISTWLYSALPSYGRKERFRPPSYRQDRWLKKHNIAWLKDRGLPYTGSAEEVRNQVSYYQNLPTHLQPKPLSETRGNIAVVINVVLYLQYMFSWCLKDSYESVAEVDFIDVRVRVFYSSFMKWIRN